MASPARAEGYYTPSQQREDSTTFMVPRLALSLGGARVLVDAAQPVLP